MAKVIIECDLDRLGPDYDGSGEPYFGLTVYPSLIEAGDPTPAQLIALQPWLWEKPKIVFWAVLGNPPQLSATSVNPRPIRETPSGWAKRMGINALDQIDKNWERFRTKPFLPDDHGNGPTWLEGLFEDFRAQNLLLEADTAERTWRTQVAALAQDNQPLPDLLNLTWFFKVTQAELDQLTQGGAASGFVCGIAFEAGGQSFSLAGIVPVFKTIGNTGSGLMVCDFTDDQGAPRQDGKLNAAIESVTAGFSGGVDPATLWYKDLAPPSDQNWQQTLARDIAAGVGPLAALIGLAQPPLAKLGKVPLLRDDDPNGLVGWARAFLHAAYESLQPGVRHWNGSRWKEALNDLPFGPILDTRLQLCLTGLADAETDLSKLAAVYTDIAKKDADLSSALQNWSAAALDGLKRVLKITADAKPALASLLADPPKAMGVTADALLADVQALLRELVTESYRHDLVQTFWGESIRNAALTNVSVALDVLRDAIGNLLVKKDEKGNMQHDDFLMRLDVASSQVWGAVVKAIETELDNGGQPDLETVRGGVKIGIKDYWSSILMKWPSGGGVTAPPQPVLDAVSERAGIAADSVITIPPGVDLAGVTSVAAANRAMGLMLQLDEMLPNPKRAPDADHHFRLRGVGMLMRIRDQIVQADLNGTTFTAVRRTLPWKHIALASSAAIARGADGKWLPEGATAAPPLPGILGARTQSRSSGLADAQVEYVGLSLTGMGSATEADAAERESSSISSLHQGQDDSAAASRLFVRSALPLYCPPDWSDFPQLKYGCFYDYLVFGQMSSGAIPEELVSKADPIHPALPSIPALTQKDVVDALETRNPEARWFLRRRRFQAPLLANADIAEGNIQAKNLWEPKPIPSDVDLMASSLNLVAGDDAHQGVDDQELPESRKRVLLVHSSVAKDNRPDRESERLVVVPPRVDITEWKYWRRADVAESRVLPADFESQLAAFQKLFTAGNTAPTATDRSCLALLFRVRGVEPTVASKDAVVLLRYANYQALNSKNVMVKLAAGASGADLDVSANDLVEPSFSHEVTVTVPPGHWIRLEIAPLIPTAWFALPTEDTLDANPKILYTGDARKGFPPQTTRRIIPADMVLRDGNASIPDPISHTTKEGQRYELHLGPIAEMDIEAATNDLPMGEDLWHLITMEQIAHADTEKSALAELMMRAKISDAARSRKFHYVRELRVERQKWRWHGRALPTVPQQAGRADGRSSIDLPYDFSPNGKDVTPHTLIGWWWEKGDPAKDARLAKAIKLDGWYFGDRSGDDAAMAKFRVAWTRSKQGTFECNTELLSADTLLNLKDAYQYYRFRFTAVSRYGRLVSSQARYATGGDPYGWRRLAMSARPERRASGKLPLPWIRIVLPLFDSEIADEPGARDKGAGFPLLIVMDGNFLSEVGLARRLECEIEAMSLITENDPNVVANNKFDVWLEHGRDPLMWSITDIERQNNGARGFGEAMIWRDQRPANEDTTVEEAIKRVVADKAKLGRKWLTVHGPYGHTFDVGADAPSIANTSFVVSVDRPALDDPPVSPLGFLPQPGDFIHLRFRSIWHGGACGHDEADLEPLASDWTPGQWLQLPYKSDRFLFQPAKQEAPVVPASVNDLVLHCDYAAKEARTKTPLADIRFKTDGVAEPGRVIAEDFVSKQEGGGFQSEVIVLLMSQVFDANGIRVPGRLLAVGQYEDEKLAWTASPDATEWPSSAPQQRIRLLLQGYVARIQRQRGAKKGEGWSSYWKDFFTEGDDVTARLLTISAPIEVVWAGE